MALSNGRVIITKSSSPRQAAAKDGEPVGVEDGVDRLFAVAAVVQDFGQAEQVAIAAEVVRRLFRAKAAVQVRADGRVPITRRQMLKRLDRDVEALTVHADYLTGRVNLAIDATVGLISLHQNDNARVFSVIATIFLPATLIASIFGMNFEVMPWLHWPHGFESSLILMVVAAVAIVLTFVFRRWL